MAKPETTDQKLDSIIEMLGTALSSGGRSLDTEPVTRQETVQQQPASPTQAPSTKQEAVTRHVATAQPEVKQQPQQQASLQPEPAKPAQKQEKPERRGVLQSIREFIKPVTPSDKTLHGLAEGVDNVRHKVVEQAWSGEQQTGRRFPSPTPEQSKEPEPSQDSPATEPTTHNQPQANNAPKLGDNNGGVQINNILSVGNATQGGEINLKDLYGQHMQDFQLSPDEQKDMGNVWGSSKEQRDSLNVGLEPSNAPEIEPDQEQKKEQELELER